MQVVHVLDPGKGGVLEWWLLHACGLLCCLNQSWSRGCCMCVDSPGPRPNQTQHGSLLVSRVILEAIHALDKRSGNARLVCGLPCCLNTVGI